MKKLLKFTPLFLIVILGLFLRFKNWPDYLPFDYEKARDLIASQNIFLNHKLTLLGPVSEVDGIFQGPSYYYLVGFFYYLFKGDPKAGSIISFSFNIAGIFIIYFIAKEFFNKRIALISSFIYAVSFEAISYAYWLSNPGPSVPCLFLMFLFFYKYLTKKGWKFLALSLFFFGLSIQFQILNIIFVFSLLIMYFISDKPKVSLKHLFISIISFFLPISTFIIFDLKHRFLMTNIFIKTYLSPTGNGTKLAFSIVPRYFGRLADEITNVLLPSINISGFILMGIILVFVIHQIIKSKDKFVWKYLLIWLFSTVPVFFIGSRMSESHAAFIGVSAAIILVIAYLVDLLSKKAALSLPIILLLIFLSNLFAINNYLTNFGKRLFDAFEGLTYKNDLSLIKYSYQIANGNDFKVDTVTSPLLISPLWDYLYLWYGNSNKLKQPLRDDKTKLQFLVIEPDVQAFWKDDVINKKKKTSVIVKETSFGRVVFQEWVKN